MALLNKISVYIGRSIRFTLVAAVFSFVLSCNSYPDLDSRLEEDLVDITKYDVNTDFTAFRTFAIVDSVTCISGKDTVRILDDQARALINQVVMNMVGRGYTLVDRKTGKPQLGINIGVVKVTNVSLYYPGWYWDYGWYDPSYWGYPASYYWYPYYPPVVSSYTSGTVIIDMLDLKNASSHDNKLYVVWLAIIRGLMTGYHTTQDVLGNVDQCFMQTPQIRAR